MSLDIWLWWSGVAFWLVLGFIGALWLGDVIVDFTVGYFWTKREFLAFVADRLKHSRR